MPNSKGKKKVSRARPRNQQSIKAFASIEERLSRPKIFAKNLLSKMWHQRLDTGDVYLAVDGVKVIKVHASVLAGASGVFKEVIKLLKDDIKVVAVDFNKQSTIMAMEHVYMGEIEGLTMENFEDVLRFAQRYFLIGVQDYIFHFLTSSLSKDNVGSIMMIMCGTYVTAKYVNRLQEFIRKNTAELTDNEKFIDAAKACKKDFVDLMYRLHQ